MIGWQLSLATIVLLFSASAVSAGTVQCTPNPNAPVTANDAFVSSLPVVFSCPGIGSPDNFDIVGISLTTTASWSVTNGARNVLYGLTIGPTTIASTDFMIGPYTFNVSGGTDSLGLAAGVGSSGPHSSGLLNVDQINPFTVSINATQFGVAGIPTSTIVALLVDYTEVARQGSQTPEPSTAMLLGLAAAGLLGKWLKASTKT